MQRVKCLIINICNGATAFPGGKGMPVPKRGPSKWGDQPDFVEIKAGMRPERERARFEQNHCVRRWFVAFFSCENDHEQTGGIQRGSS